MELLKKIWNKIYEIVSRYWPIVIIAILTIGGAASIIKDGQYEYLAPFFIFMGVVIILTIIWYLRGK